MATRTHSAVGDRYLDLLKKTLTRYLMIDEEVTEALVPSAWWTPTRLRDRLWQPCRRYLAKRGLRLVVTGGDPAARAKGTDWPPTAETMVGLARLDNVQHCISTIIADNVPGDLIETGVWRGGTGIFMRAALEAFGDEHRTVWLADSFEGLPPPNPGAYPADQEDLSVHANLAVGLDQVKANLAKYGLLDDRVRFLVGWFKDTLPAAPVDRLSLLRLDGDYYESTMQALDALYPKLSPGGFVVVDDYSVIPACKQAVDEYREAHAIVDELVAIDGTAVYWRRST